MSKLHVVLSTDRTNWLAYGGSPGGRDAVHHAVSKWPGWKRLRTRGQIPDLPGSAGIGADCSIYSAPVNAITAGCLNNYTRGVAWDRDSYNAGLRVIDSLNKVSLALCGKPSKQWDSRLRQPMPHQAQALDAMDHMGGRVLLADDMGLGKTSTALWAIWPYFGHPGARTLVICPASVKFNWRKETWAVLGDDTWVEVIDGTEAERASQLADVMHRQHEEGCGVVIINYDLLIRLPDLGLQVLREWVDGQALICDESYYLKNRKSQRFRIVHNHFAPAKGGAKLRILMSGTPVRNLVDDLYAQVELIRPGTWTSYTDFCNRHLDIAVSQLGQDQVINGKLVKAKKIYTAKGGKDLDRLNAVMNTLQIRRKKEDVLKLPPMTITKPELVLEDDYLRMYQVMKKWAMLELEEAAKDNVFMPTIGSAAQAVMRCEQIAQGFVGGVPDHIMEKPVGKLILRNAAKIKGRPNELVFPHSPKMEWLTETIESVRLQGGRPVVFSRFNAPLLWLRHVYEHDSVMMHGGQTSKMKDDVVDIFESGERDIFLCQLTIAEGFTLISSQDELFLNRWHAPAVNNQAMARCHRIGQKGTVNVQIPIVINTIEKKIDEKLDRKEADAEGALKGMTIEELMEAL